MKKLFLAILLLGALSVLSGCAVIDFLDGKYQDRSADYDRPQYGAGAGAGAGAGGCGGHPH